MICFFIACDVEENLVNFCIMAASELFKQTRMISAFVMKEFEALSEPQFICSAVVVLLIAIHSLKLISKLQSVVFRTKYVSRNVSDRIYLALLMMYWGLITSLTVTLVPAIKNDPASIVGNIHVQMTYLVAVTLFMTRVLTNTCANLARLVVDYVMLAIALSGLLPACVAWRFIIITSLAALSGIYGALIMKSVICSNVCMCTRMCAKPAEPETEEPKEGEESPEEHKEEEKEEEPAMKDATPTPKSPATIEKERMAKHRAGLRIDPPDSPAYSTRSRSKRME